jgi:hypothetical protein
MRSGAIVNEWKCTSKATVTQRQQCIEAIQDAHLMQVLARFRFCGGCAKHQTPFACDSQVSRWVSKSQRELGLVPEV